MIVVSGVVGLGFGVGGIMGGFFEAAEGVVGVEGEGILKLDGGLDGVACVVFVVSAAVDVGTVMGGGEGGGGCCGGVVTG